MKRLAFLAGALVAGSFSAMVDRDHVARAEDSRRFAIDSTRAADSVQMVRVGLWCPYLSDSIEAERIGASARR